MIKETALRAGLLRGLRPRLVGIEACRLGDLEPQHQQFMERLIGTLRRERVDRLLIFNEAHLRQILTSCACYYNDSRTHLSLHKDTRWVERSKDTEILPLRPFCRDCIIATRGYDF